MESAEGINKLYFLSTAFNIIIIHLPPTRVTLFEVDQIVVLDETRSWRGSPVLATLLAHLPASGKALSLPAARVLPETTRRARGRQATFEACRAPPVIAVLAAASIPHLTT